MKFSIITVVYNNLEMLKGCIDSLGTQNSINYEHIIQDAASTDGTYEYLESLNNDKLKIITEKDEGIYDGLNKAMRRISGDIVGIIHSDDIYPNELVLSRVQAEFEKDFDIVYGDLEYVSQENTSNVFRSWASGPFNKKKLVNGWMPPHPSFYFKANLLKEIGEYDTSYKIAADYDFMLKILTLPEIKVSYLPLTLMKMRVGGSSNKSLKNIILKMKEDYQTMKRYFPVPAYTLLMKNVRKINQIKISYFKKS